MQDVPQNHLVEAHKLHGADGVVELFRISLVPSGRIYLKNENKVTWQGNEYEAIPINLSGVSQNADEGRSRPKLQVANPEGMFSPFVAEHSLDKAVVSRYRVLYDDLINDRNVFTVQSWIVTRIVSLNKRQITMEMRSPTDGPFFTLPARVFIGPEFPAVSLR